MPSRIGSPVTRGFGDLVPLTFAGFGSLDALAPFVVFASELCFATRPTPCPGDDLSSGRMLRPDTIARSDCFGRHAGVVQRQNISFPS